MNAQALGPRTIYYVAKDGSHHPIQLNVEFFPVKMIDLGDAQVEQFSGAVSFDCDWTMKPITICGLDELQVVYWLMKIADTALQRLSKDNDLGLFKNIPGDINEPMDVFS